MSEAQQCPECKKHFTTNKPKQNLEFVGTTKSLREIAKNSCTISFCFDAGSEEYVICIYDKEDDLIQTIQFASKEAYQLINALSRIKLYGI